MSEKFKEVGSTMALAARQWRARADERLAPLGLTQAKWVPLRYLAFAGGSLPQRRLVELTGIEGPSLVRLLDDLERMGLVERRCVLRDRRTKTVHLTEKATPLIEEIGLLAEALRAELLDGIPDEDLTVFARVLGRISHRLEDMAR